MLKPLIARLRNSEIDLRLLVPLLLGTILVQVITAIIRVTTSYRAVELGMSIVWLGVIAAAFALFPILIAVRTGRFIDRGHDALTNWIGSALLAASALGFVFWSSSVALVVVTATMGIGHMMLMTSQQMLCVRAATPRSMESVFGNYMVAGAIGQGIGPYVVGWAGGTATVPPTHSLFIVAFVIALVSLAVSLSMRRDTKTRPQLEPGAKPVPVGTLLRVPGLLPVVIAGVIMVSASDIILIYVPLLGSERNIDVKDIGLLLTVRAAASMTARLFYARMVAATGRWPLMISSTFACALAFGALAAPVSLFWMFVIMVVMGFSFGLATTLSITIVVDMTTANARGTANSLRIMGNRLGQFVLPFGAGLVAVATGLTGLFLIIAAAIAVSAGAMHMKRPAPDTPSD
jgi:MFS family permease